MTLACAAFDDLEERPWPRSGERDELAPAAPPPVVYQALGAVIAVDPQPRLVALCTSDEAAAAALRLLSGAAERAVVSRSRQTEGGGF